MSTQWLKGCALNLALHIETQVLRDLNTKIKGKISELEVLLAEKDENLKSIAIELERTQKMVMLLNNGTSKLDHLITTGKSFDDHSGVGYKYESFGILTIFVKSSLLDDSFNVSVKKTCCEISYNRKHYVVKQSITIGESVSNSW